MEVLRHGRNLDQTAAVWKHRLGDHRRVTVLDIAERIERDVAAHLPLPPLPGDGDVAGNQRIADAFLAI
jgi:hypothetical protein